MLLKPLFINEVFKLFIVLCPSMPYHKFLRRPLSLNPSNKTLCLVLLLKERMKAKHAQALLPGETRPYLASLEDTKGVQLLIAFALGRLGHGEVIERIDPGDATGLDYPDIRYYAKLLHEASQEEGISDAELAEIIETFR